MTHSSIAPGIVAQPGTGVWMKANSASVFAPLLPEVPVIYQAPRPGASSEERHMRQVVELHDRLGLASPRVDAARYMGRKWKSASQEPSESWTEAQWRAGIDVARTDSGYVAADAPVDHIRMILRAAEQHTRSSRPEVEAVLPLDATWLSKRANELEDVLGGTSVPVSLLLGHTRDPLGTRSTVRGLVQILQSHPVSIDRSDLSSAIALAFGARAGTIGVSAALRHVYPPEGASGGGPVSNSPSVLIESMYCWKTTDRLPFAMAVLERDELWRCSCDVCRGEYVGYAVTDSVSAFRHSIDVAVRFAESVASSPRPFDTVRARIHSAQSNALEASSRLDSTWDPQGFLAAWLQALPARVHV